MTDEQLDVARAHIEEYTAKLGYKKPNMTFIKGFIERLGEAGVPDESVDIIMSNCVVNLSPDKLSVLSEAYRYAQSYLVALTSLHPPYRVAGPSMCTFGPKASNCSMLRAQFCLVSIRMQAYV